MTLIDVADLIEQEEIRGPNNYVVHIDKTVTQALISPKSVRRSEYWDAQKSGTKLVIAFEMWLADYDNQPLVDYNGKRYKVERAYASDNETVELNCSEVVR